MKIDQKEAVILTFEVPGSKWNFLLPGTDFKFDFKTCMSSDWTEVMEQQLKPIFDAESGPLWR